MNALVKDQGGHPAVARLAALTTFVLAFLASPLARAMPMAAWAERPFLVPWAKTASSSRPTGFTTATFMGVPGEVCSSYSGFGVLRTRAGDSASSCTRSSRTRPIPQGDARDQRAHLRDVQDVPRDPDQVHLDARGVHRRRHRCVLLRHQAQPVFVVAIILIFSLIGIAGSCAVAWFGIRVLVRRAPDQRFASLRGKPFPVLSDPPPEPA